MQQQNPASDNLERRPSLWKWTQSARMQVVSCFVSAVVAGSLLGTGWRSEQMGWLGVLGISFFLLGQTRLTRLTWSLCNAFVTGFMAFAIACPWLPATARYLAEVGTATSLGLAVVYFAFQSLGLVLFALFWRAVRRAEQPAWVLVPVIWVGVEQIIPTLFPWPPAALLTADLAMIQIAEFGGVHLASMLVLSIATYFAWTVNEFLRLLSGRKFRPQTFGLSLALLLVLLGIRWAGSARIEQIDAFAALSEGEPLRVGLVQADTGFTDSNQRMIESTRAMQGLIDLAVWPESSLGDYCRELQDFNDPERVARLSVGEDTQFVPFPEPHCPLLAGADRWDDDQADGDPDRHFVSALLIDQRECLVGSREKVRLMPYGEYFPGEFLLPLLRTWFGNERVITPGDSALPIGPVAGFRLGVLLCCEDMHSDLVREVVGNGVDCLITLGNGLAFDSEIALRQHFRIAQLRSIEHRLSFLRCTSSGVSGLIAPSGRVCHELPAMQDAAAVIPISKRPSSIGPTLFSRYGSLLPLVIGVLSLFFWVGSYWRAGGVDARGITR